MEFLIVLALFLIFLTNWKITVKIDLKIYVY